MYNATVDWFGRPLTTEYTGGLWCCHERAQCRLRNGFEGQGTRTLYLRYAVTWVDWDSSVLPLQIYILDVADSWEKSNGSTAIGDGHHCGVEYEVKPCKSNSVGDETCVDPKRKSFVMPFDGYIVYGVAYQHTGGIGSALYREDGRVICSSVPTYGEGVEPGNEAGYIFGMSTCYPESVKVTSGETLIVESNYSSATAHTGVMGLFSIMVAQRLPETGSL